MYYVYFLRSLSNPDKTYIGYTNDLERRLVEHNEGQDTSSHTNRFKPWQIEAYVMADTQETALIVEAYFKNTSGKEKIKKFEQENPLHPNATQGFFDTLNEGRAFGKDKRRIIYSKNKNNKAFFTKKLDT